jgi:cell division protein FtsX
MFDEHDPLDDEDEATLTAIDRAIEGVREGRVVSAEEARKRMEQWLQKPLQGEPPG